jgi:hypothetical protein
MLDPALEAPSQPGGTRLAHETSMRTYDTACTVSDGDPHKSVDVAGTNARTIYWHRELPPLAATPIAEHVIEAVSGRVPGALSRRDALWTRCHQDLMAHVADRLQQEIERLGGCYAHVLDESIDSRHDDATDESWLAGRFRYILLA